VTIDDLYRVSDEAFSIALSVFENEQVPDLKQCIAAMRKKLADLKTSEVGKLSGVAELFSEAEFDLDYASEPGIVTSTRLGRAIRRRKETDA
jgi:hypothetical protein